MLLRIAIATIAGITGFFVATSAAGESITPIKPMVFTIPTNRYVSPGATLENTALPAHVAALRAAAEATAQKIAAEQARAARTARYGRTGVNWDSIAQCETGGNWQMQGPRYSGGVGFYNGTWDGFGGREFASNAGLASREEQIIVAERVHDEHGLSGWGCASYG